MENKDKIVDLLNKTIETCIYSPGGDPISDTLQPAANCVEILHLLGEESSIDSEVLQVLRGQNIENCNYLDRLGYSHVE